MEIQLPELEGPEIEAWDLLFDLYRTHPTGWAVVGAQMVVLHSASHGVGRPVRTGDTDVLVDIRALSLREVSAWLLEKDFELEGMSAAGIGHRFVRRAVTIDLLSIDHAGEASRTTVPPTRASPLLTDEVWASVARFIEPRNGKIAISVLLSPLSDG